MKKAIFLLSILFISFQVCAQDMNKDAAVAYNTGNELQRQGDFEGAIKKYDEALAIEKDYRIYYQKGLALKKVNRIDDSKNAYLKSLELKNDFDGVYNALGGIEFSKGNFNEAIGYFEKFEQTTKNAKNKSAAKEYIARSYTKLGENAKNDGNLEKAVEYLNKATESFKYDAAYLLLSNVYYDMGKFDQAIEAANLAIDNRKNVSKGAPHYYKGLAFKGKGDVAKAKENFEEGRKDAKYKQVCEHELSLLK